MNNEEATNLQEEQSNAADEAAGSDNVSGEVEALQKKYNELNDSHLRLMAEFDNYRKRTMREKADLIKTGGEGALKNLLLNAQHFIVIPFSHPCICYLPIFRLFSHYYFSVTYYLVK